MKYKMTIEGMSCMHCAARVEKALAALGAEAKVDLQGGYALVTAPENLGQSELSAAVTEAGYDVVKVEKA